MRLAEEYDAAQERGEVSKGGGRPDCVEDRNAVPATAADLGLRRDEIHEARKLRDAAPVTSSGTTGARAGLRGGVSPGLSFLALQLTT